MAATDATDAPRGRRFLTALFWLGIGLAPIAALILLVGDSETAQRISGVVAIAAVVLIGLSLALRGSGPESLRRDIEENVRNEVGALRAELASSTRASTKALDDRIQALQGSIDALRDQVGIAAPTAAPTGAAPNGKRPVAVGVRPDLGMTRLDAGAARVDTGRADAGPVYGDAARADTGAVYGDRADAGSAYGDRANSGSAYGDRVDTGSVYGDRADTGSAYGEAGAGRADTGQFYGEAGRADTGSVYGGAGRADTGSVYGDTGPVYAESGMTAAEPGWRREPDPYAPGAPERDGYPEAAGRGGNGWAGSPAVPVPPVDQYGQPLTYRQPAPPVPAGNGRASVPAQGAAAPVSPHGGRAAVPVANGRAAIPRPVSGTAYAGAAAQVPARQVSADPAQAGPRYNGGGVYGGGGGGDWSNQPPESHRPGPAAGAWADPHAADQGHRYADQGHDDGYWSDLRGGGNDDWALGAGAEPAREEWAAEQGMSHGYEASVGVSYEDRWSVLRAGDPGYGQQPGYDPGRPVARWDAPRMDMSDPHGWRPVPDVRHGDDGRHPDAWHDRGLAPGPSADRGLAPGPGAEVGQRPWEPPVLPPPVLPPPSGFDEPGAWGQQAAEQHWGDQGHRRRDEQEYGYPPPGDVPRAGGARQQPPGFFDEGWR
jgi:hypothetical protein